MIKVLNPDKLTGQTFFNTLFNYLLEHDDVTLRQIKQDFSNVEQLERSLEAYIQAGYILRQNRRYDLNVTLLQNAKDVQLDDMVFVDEESVCYQELSARRFDTSLTNTTNQVVLVESTDFERQRLSLSNYFHKLALRQPLSAEQEKLYAILGDVNPEYALKYLTTFLLKFLKKDVVKQKRPDIFVDSLLCLGYLERIDDTSYRLAMTMDTEKMVFIAP